MDARWAVAVRTTCSSTVMAQISAARRGATTTIIPPDGLGEPEHRPPPSRTSRVRQARQRAHTSSPRGQRYDVRRAPKPSSTSCNSGNVAPSPPSPRATRVLSWTTSSPNEQPCLQRVVMATPAHGPWQRRDTTSRSPYPPPTLNRELKSKEAAAKGSTWKTPPKPPEN